MATMPGNYPQYQTTHDPAGELAIALDPKARRISSGRWRCRCPAHDDSDPSLDLRTMPGGFVVWYDFFVNNPANPDVRGAGRAELARMFSGCEMELSRITVAAPLGRAIATLPSLYATLARCRIFCTHYLGWIRKP